MKITLKEMVFYGYHGVHAEERKLGQRFVVTAELFTDPALDPSIRRLEDTTDYTRVYADIREIVENHQFLLLESCANSIADKLLESYPLLTKVTLQIQKPSVPIQGSLKSVEVELTRER
ncbi:MAG TPA: dihydroneopterin aldolase [Candidatus Cloacimonadota bacterium]|nr:dihydroneopterin aldolase [Candidatus Cloacimonadota bacterium]HPS38187.1 dihydroneopterin aldolase [Candidatus Cloacimonadota bacterium]